jgi:hypothetical protein
LNLTWGYESEPGERLPDESLSRLTGEPGAEEVLKR